MMRYAVIIAALAVAGCAEVDVQPNPKTSSPASSLVAEPAGSHPTVPSGPLDPATADAIDAWLATVHTADWDVTQASALVDGGDVRTAWLIADLLRFYQGDSRAETLIAAFTELTGATPEGNEVGFVWTTNQLLSWDIPAWDGYPGAKRLVFGGLRPTWDRFFEEDQGVDWRLVTWGGVFPDDRPLGDSGGCERCIPALDHPETTDAEGGDWYPDRDVVFGVVLDGEALALPKHQMEVHEMVHVSLAGRELGIPYCTLCGSAQAYYVDEVPGVERVVLRTSGLLSRSNKLMYDLATGSAIDTFTGEALTGRLAEDEVTLEQVSVVASTWGDWKEAHPQTRILAEDGGIGRTYVEDPLRGRDDAGPIFPIGEVDHRLPTSEKVVGVIRPDGTPIAFPVLDVKRALRDSELVFEGLTVRLEDSIRVYDSAGMELVSHEAFWFAWSQFHPGSLLWSP